MDVTDNQGVNPALSYIDPFTTMGTNFTASLNAQVSGQQHRNINVSFTMLFGKNLVTDEAAKKCNPSNSRLGLRGDLGISEIIATGLRYTTGYPYQNEYPYKLLVIGVSTLLAPADPLTGGAALAPSFGSTVDFTLIYGAGGGPNWTLTHFVGVNPASGTGLLTFMRTNKDTLVLSVARVEATAPAPPGASQAQKIDAQRASDTAQIAAGRSAQDNVTRMILQQIVPPR